MLLSILNNIFIFNSFYFNIISFIFIIIIPIIIFLKNFFELQNIRFFESLILISLLVSFSLILVFTHDLIVIYIILEAVSFILYAILGIQYDYIDRSESIIKYFLLNTIASLLILFGISLLFNMTNEVNYYKFSLITNKMEITTLIIISILFILLGIFFKIGSFPMSIWTIDVYETIPFIFTIILLTVIKLSYLVLLFNFLYETFFINIIFLKFVIFVSGVSSILIGCFGALLQKKLKRFVIYTTINQIGFILLGYSNGTTESFVISFIYIIIYLCLNINFFFIITYFRNKMNPNGLLYLTDFAFVAKTNFKLLINFILILFAFAGAPPLIGFFTKYFLFVSLFDTYTNAIFYFGTIIGLFASVVSTFYYLRFIKIILFDRQLLINRSTKNNFNKNIKLFLLMVFFNIYFTLTNSRFSKFLVYFTKIEFVNVYLNLFIFVNLVIITSSLFFYPIVDAISFFYKSILLI